MKKLILLLFLAALPSFGAITVIQSTQCDSAGSAVISLPCSFGSAVTAGNSIVVAATTYNTTLTADDDHSSVYHADGNANLTPNTSAIFVSHADNVTSGTLTVTAHVGASSYIIIHMYEVAGLATSSLDQTATVALNTSQPTPSVGPTSATTVADEFVFAAFSSNSTTSASAGSGYNIGELTPNVNATVVSQFDEYAIATATGAQTAPLSIGAAFINGYAGVLITLKAAGGGGGGGHTSMPIVASFGVSSELAHCQAAAVNGMVFTGCSDTSGVQSSATAIRGPSVVHFTDITCLLYVNDSDSPVPLLGTVAPHSANIQCAAAGVLTQGTISLAPGGA